MVKTHGWVVAEANSGTGYAVLKKVLGPNIPKEQRIYTNKGLDSALKERLVAFLDHEMNSGSVRVKLEFVAPIEQGESYQPEPAHSFEWAGSSLWLALHSQGDPECHGLGFRTESQGESHLGAQHEHLLFSQHSRHGGVGEEILVLVGKVASIQHKNHHLIVSPARSRYFWCGRKMWARSLSTAKKRHSR